MNSAHRLREAPTLPCLWCGGGPADSYEHIVSGALACPPNFVLAEGVCDDCNHRNGRLDRALLKPFEMATVVRGIPRKKGRPPTIDGFSTVASRWRGVGPEIYMNREKFSVVSPAGKRLGPTSKADEFQDFTHEPQPDGQVKISFKQRLRFDRTAVRGLFKTALESVAFFHGVEFVLDSQFDPIRSFVRRDQGDFLALLLDGGPFNSYFAPPQSKDNRPLVVGMTILGLGFMCDFDPEFRNGRELEEEIARQGLGCFRLPN